jgi:hypothetical protein
MTENIEIRIGSGLVVELLCSMCGALGSILGTAKKLPLQKMKMTKVAKKSVGKSKTM